MSAKSTLINLFAVTNLGLVVGLKFAAWTALAWIFVDGDNIWGIFQDKIQMFDWLRRDCYTLYQYKSCDRLWQSLKELRSWQLCVFCVIKHSKLYFQGPDQSRLVPIVSRFSTVKAIPLCTFSAIYTHSMVPLRMREQNRLTWIGWPELRSEAGIVPFPDQ
jgi:hypothetical protein